MRKKPEVWWSLTKSMAVTLYSTTSSKVTRHRKRHYFHLCWWFSGDDIDINCKTGLNQQLNLWHHFQRNTFILTTGTVQKFSTLQWLHRTNDNNICRQTRVNHFLEMSHLAAPQASINNISSILRSHGYLGTMVQAVTTHSRHF